MTSDAATTISTSTSDEAPGPTQTGITANCHDWYLAESGDTCYDIASSHGITLGQFYAWNPAVGGEFPIQISTICIQCLKAWLETDMIILVLFSIGDCSGLQADQAYCVGVVSTSTTFTSTRTVSATTGTVTSVTPPAPTQPGIPSNCNAYAVAESGDGCETFVDCNSITLAQLCKLPL
jgi:hypothetical protein